jgi:tetratricopeptide (TPR) repeat protein
VQLFGSIGNIPSSACAASASVWDVAESYRVAHLLDVFATAGKGSAIYLLREFCLATAEVVAVKTRAACDRYSRLFEIFQGKVFGLDELSLEQLRCGCLNGKAQALVTDCAPEALTLADELERRGAFFAPHAAGVRMTYHLYRGETHKAVAWRERAESLALRAGTSWSALTMLTLRMVQGSVAIGDVVALVHVVAELARLAKIAPNIETIHALAEGHLELLRGHPERALAIYERVLPSERARALPSYPMEGSLHARALAALGRHEEARALCLALLTDVESSQREGDQNTLMPRLRLANAEAELGNFAGAVELVDGCFERAGRFDNPLAIGSVHRERARIALLAGDHASFELHLAATSAHFAATENPWLIQQTDALRAEGARLGTGSAEPLQTRPIDDMDGSTELHSIVAPTRDGSLRR